MSGGQTTVANLFYNMASRQVGLVGLWDVVADEVAGLISKTKMESNHERLHGLGIICGQGGKTASASMVSWAILTKTLMSWSRLLTSLSLFETMATDTAFLTECITVFWLGDSQDATRLITIAMGLFQTILPSSSEMRKRSLLTHCRNTLAGEQLKPTWRYRCSEDCFRTH